MDGVDFSVPVNNVNLYLELLRKRDRFLTEHPELKLLQNRIDLTLKEVGNDPIDRCKVITLIMNQSLYNLQRSYNEMINQVNNLIGEINDIKNR